MPTNNITPDMYAQYGLTPATPSPAATSSASAAGPSAGPSAADAYAKRVGYNQPGSSGASTNNGGGLSSIGAGLEESAEGAYSAVVSPLERIGGAVETGLDQTLGRGINMATGRGNTPTNSGQEEMAHADETAASSPDTLAGHVGNFLGNVAPYFTGVGEEEMGAKLATMVPKIAETLGVDASKLTPKVMAFLAKKIPSLTKNIGIGTAQTGDVKSGIAQGVGGELLADAPGVIKGGAKLVKGVAGTTDLAGQALKDVTPDFEKLSPTAREKMLNENVKLDSGASVPRVQMQNGTRVVNNTQLEKDAAAELRKVPGYDKASTQTDKFNLAKAQIGAEAKALRGSLKAETVVVPKREVYSAVKKAIDGVPEESLLLQSADPAITNYTRVLQNAVAKEPGNLEGVLNMRQTLDDAYDNARGKLAYPGGEEKLAALDEVHTAARDTLTKYLVDHAVTTGVKASLKAQWDLYRATDVLRTSAAREGGTTLQRVMQNNPKTTAVVKAGLKTAAGAAGLGAGIHLLP